jgi:hypothetical protein
MCVYIEMYLNGLDRSERKRFIGWVRLVPSHQFVAEKRAVVLSCV